MGNKTGIEWTDATWNPIRGCSRVSEGCRNCYAEKVAYRFSGAGQPYEGLAHQVNGHAAWTGKVQLVEEHLLDPLKWKGRPIYNASDEYKRVGFGPGMRIFVNSMSDLFHENVPDEWIDRIFAVMALCPQHTFQILTKRPERMLAYLSASNIEARIAYACVHNGQPIAPGYFSMAPGGDLWEVFGVPGKLRFVDERVNGGVPCSTGKWAAADFDKWPLPNVQLGVSVENQPTADKRIPLLLDTPAAVRYISGEPLLYAVCLRKYLQYTCRFCGELVLSHKSLCTPVCATHGDVIARRPLDWVIVGGESGPGARPMHPDWARGVRDQCEAAGVPFFFKQWGEWAEVERRHDLPARPWMVGKRDVIVNIDGSHDAFEECGGIGGGTPMCRVGKKAAGSLLDGKEYKEFPR